MSSGIGASPNRKTHCRRKCHFGERFEIRDLGSHTPATVTTFALLLASAVNVRPDPKRRNFYEVVDGSQVYYIHVSPVTEIIYLLAVWQNAVVRSNTVLRPRFPSPKPCSPLAI